ncbi:unnamed protein product [Rotaria magnacalcarata]|nr:unnamed protein product [Rotaria magnacalcarata]
MMIVQHLKKNEYEAKLDWILGSQPLLSFITNVETHPTIGTINGHELLTFDITIGAEPKVTSPRLSLNFKAVKWTNFRSKLDQQLILWNNDLSLNSPLNIEDYSMFIANSIMLATQEAVPTSTSTSKSYALSEASKSLIKLKHQAYRRWKRTGDNIDKQRYAQNQPRCARPRRHSAVILFDIKAAFDSVCHDGLIYKLNDLRLPKYIINYLTSFLKDRTASIEIENVLSRQFNLKSGTPQRSPLSPLLYIIYTAASINEISTHTEHGLFADDTELWTSVNTMTSLSFRLQHSVDAFETWCKSWKLKLQTTKTEMIHFTIHPRKKYKHSVEVKVDNTIIKPLYHTRYLGVIIDKQLNWRRHLDHIKTRIAPRIGLLRYLSRTAYEPNSMTMINIFKSIARSIIIYGHPVLLTADQNVWNRIQIIQNKALGAALGLPIYTSVDYIHKISNIPKIKDYATILLKQFIQTATEKNDITAKKHLQDVLEKIL